MWEAIQQLQQSPLRMAEDDAYELMKELVFAAIVDNSNSIPSAVQIMFEADDDDHDLTNGTPHSTQLVSAAASRSIPVPPQLPRLPLPAASFVPMAAQFAAPDASATPLQGASKPSSTTIGLPSRPGLSDEARRWATPQ